MIDVRQKNKMSAKYCVSLDAEEAVYLECS
jgi:hypothetical protein